MVSRLTCYKIQNQDVEVLTYSDKDLDKYGFIIQSKVATRHPILVSSNAVYNSISEAQESGDNTLAKILKIDI